MAAGNRSRRWSNLPSDLIHLISTKLPDLSDRVRIRAVCKMWKSSVSASDPSPCLPWFVSSEMDGTDEFVYYCLSSKKTCTIHCPQQRNSHIHGTAGGFILCCKDRHTCPQSISLFNPLTGLEISVPKPKESKKFSVVSNPFQKDLVVILGLQDSKNFVGSIRPGDDAWVIRRLDMMLYEELCVWYNGMCYIKEYGIPPWIGDGTTRSVLSTVPLPPPPAPRGPHPILKPRYMLETCGEILLIFMHSTSICELEEIYFSIYRLNKMGEEENYQWVKVRGIGDRMLFLDNVRSFVLKASDFSGFTRNCIYFQSYDYKRLRFLLCRHDLDTGTTKVLPNFSGKYWSTWMIPNLSKSN